ncbi:MAG: hypothetical protein ACTS73_07000 [Arsenophonus sp. NEOnobi-MAG3]
MICHEKSTLQISAKPDIICDPLCEFICNACQAVDKPPSLTTELEVML